MEGGSGLGGGAFDSTVGKGPESPVPSVVVLNSSSFLCSCFCVGEGDLSRLGVASTDEAGDLVLPLSLAPPKPSWSLRLPPWGSLPLPSILPDPAELLRARVDEKGFMRRLPTSPNLTGPLVLSEVGFRWGLVRPLSAVSRGGPCTGRLRLSSGIDCSRPNCLLLCLVPVAGSTVVVLDITVPPTSCS